MRYVLVKRFAELTGYTIKAIERKIEEGIWVQNREWRKAPDGHKIIDVEGYYKWVEGNPAAA